MTHTGRGASSGVQAGDSRASLLDLQTDGDASSIASVGSGRPDFKPVESANRSLCEAGTRHTSGASRLAGIPGLQAEEDVNHSFLDFVESGSAVTFELKGQAISGVFERTNGLPWVQPHDRGSNAVLLCDSALDGAALSGFRVVQEAKSEAEKDRSRFGELAYTQPTTRNEYESTLWDLAVKQKEARKDIDHPEYITGFRRASQIEAQFSHVADQIALSEPKRRYMVCEAFRRRDGLPLRSPQDIASVPLAMEIPKPQDFDPDPIARRKRSLRPALSYEPLAQVQDSLRSALNALVGRRISPQKRRQLETLVAKRRREIAKGQYREAVAHREAHTQH